MLKTYSKNILLLLICLKEFFRRLFSRKKSRPLDKDLNILVLMTGKIGDLVCATPFFRELKKARPNYRVTAVIHKIGRAVLEFNPNVDEIIEINEYFKSFKNHLELVKLIKSKNFGWSFVLMPGPLVNTVPYLAGIKNRAAVEAKGLGTMTSLSVYFNNHIIHAKRETLFLDYYLKLLGFIGIETCNRKKDLYLNLKIADKVNQFLDKQGIKKSKQMIFGISVTAGVELKEWMIEKFAALADILIKKYGAKIVFIGSDNDREKVQTAIDLMKEPAVSLAGRLTLEELPYLMKRLDLFISGDVGPSFFANAMDIPMVVILGPADVFAQAPIYEKCEPVVKYIYCYPCSFCPASASHCKEGHLRCLKETTVQDVEEAVDRAIKKYILNE